MSLKSYGIVRFICIDRQLIMSAVGALCTHIATREETELSERTGYT